MKTFQFVDRTLIVGDVSQWDQLLGAVAKDIPATVVDLRTFVEASDEAPPRSPEGWGYRRLPITGATVSEQDLDVLRREFFRRTHTVVVGPNSSRSRLLVAAALSRLEQGGWQGGARAEADPKHGESALQNWLSSYLARHGFEAATEETSQDNAATVDETASSPAPTDKPKKSSQKKKS